MIVVIADDHPMVRDALARVVRQLDVCTEVFEAGDYPALVNQVVAVMPSLVLVDLNMPGMDGLAGLRRLRERFPLLPIVVASGQDDPATIRAALATGASGFIPKVDPPNLLLQALRVVHAGGVYVPASSLGDIRHGHPSADAGVANLTPRQLDVLHLLMRGDPNKAIARELGLTEGTVKIHLAAILRALNARNRTEAVVRARELGIDRST